MEVGPHKSRPRSTAVYERFNMTWVLTGTQLAALKTFYETTLAQGSLEFDFTHPETDATVVAKFMTAPSRTMLSGHSATGSRAFRVSCDLIFIN